MKHIFGEDSFLFRILTILMEFAFMNLLFLFLSIPLVTAGAAYTALTENLYLFLKKGEGCFSSRYFVRVFLENIKSSAMLWIPGAVSMGILIYGIRLWTISLQGWYKIILTGVYILVFLFVFGILQFWHFLCGRGKKPGKELLKDCFLLTLAKLPVILLLLFITISPAFFLLLPGAAFIRILPVILLYGVSFPAFFNEIVGCPRNGFRAPLIFSFTLMYLQSIRLPDIC